MVGFVLQRLFGTIVTITTVCILVFLMTRMMPGDAVLQLTGPTSFESKFTSSKRTSLKRYHQIAAQLNLDRPLFYFSIVPASYPDTLFTMAVKEDKYRLRSWYYQSGGHWNLVQDINDIARNIVDSLLKISADDRTRIGSYLLNFYSTGISAKGRSIVNSALVDSTVINSPSLKIQFEKLSSTLNTMPNRSLGIPALRWHGAQNQFHIWISNLLKGDFGRSLQDGRSANTKIKEALSWTLSINLIAILLSLLISIPLGVYLSAFASKFARKWIQTIIYFFYSIPVFLLATLLVVFFTTDEFGAWTNIFPTVGVVEAYMGGTFGERFLLTGSKLVLPVFCLVITSLAYLSRMIKAGMDEQLLQEYMITAKAKGLGKKKRIWRHAFPNALFPLATVFSSIIPAAIAGSITIEYIFNIPGMGRLMLQAIEFKDWNIVLSIVVLTALLTSIGILITDVFYAWLDPRVKGLIRK